MKFGYTLFSEGNDPISLVQQARQAEEAGFDFVAISDHYSPWLGNQEHAPFAWSVLGAVAQATDHIQLATMVTCPIMRYHPTIVAQMAATIGVLSQGRFTLGLGAGERLNEHIIGAGWPSTTVRHLMLREAIDIIQALWSGEYVTYYGAFFNVEHARVFDLPQDPLDMFAAASGKKSAAIAAEKAGGLCFTKPDKQVVDTYTGMGGDKSNIWAQVAIPWGKTKEIAAEDAYRDYRFSLVGGSKVHADLANPATFDENTQGIKPQDIGNLLRAYGPGAGQYIKQIQSYADLGVSHLSLHYIGHDFTGFFDFWDKELRPQLGSMAR